MPEHPALGLGRSKTILRPHDPRWAAAFETEAATLRSVLVNRPVEVEHIGSTAVPALSAKPILDIAVGYHDASGHAEIQAALEAVEYVFHGDQGEEGGLFFVKGPDSCRTHHLHVVAAGSSQWRSYLAFRDKLRSSKTLRTAYAELKENLTAQFPEDRVSYQDAKSPFIEDALRGSNG
jgi:GrpB-like predicted nucleotidyltransferase (UPF0157 family)